jgi:two-component system phosphate regulon sensor histidine kinase PhoR
MVRVLWQGQSYRNLLYLLISLPLGESYLICLTLALVIGAGLAVVLVGVPILAGTVATWWALGAFERQLAMWWLGVDIPPMLHPYVPAGTRWRWLRIARAYLTAQLTWTCLGFLLLKLPLGILGLLVCAALAVAAGLVAMPVIFLATYEGGSDAAFVFPVLAPLAVLVGVALAAGALHAANGVAWAAGRAAQSMLGTSDTGRHLAAARAAAEREQAKAERAERSRQELIVNVGHELRTPAASIRGHVESLLLSLEGEPAGPTPEQLRHHLGVVNRETQRLSTLIDELLTLARADAGELRLELAPVPADEVVEEVCQILTPLAQRERQVSVVREIAPGLPPVVADRQRLVQVLLNLVRNAITYTPAGGIVAVAVDRFDTARLAITVADTGVGIPPEDLEKVFERFYRSDPSRTRSSGGFGLGLAIVRDLVQAWGVRSAPRAWWAKGAASASSYAPRRARPRRLSPPDADDVWTS